MAKLSLDANPTFPAKVAIPVAGGAPVDVAFTFKHRTRDALNDFLTTADKRTDVETLLGIVEGWELDDALNADNMLRLTQSYLGAARAIIEKYIEEMTQAKAKN